MDVEPFIKLPKTLILTFAFLIISPFVILASLTTLTNIYPPKSQVKATPKTPIIAYSSTTTTTEPTINSTIESADSRVYLVTEYLKRYKSPLLEHASEIVRVSDMYSLDYRLLIAIAQQESNLCKIIPTDSYNCWGWGIHSKGSLGFASYKEAFHTVAKGVKEEYINKGYTTPDEIMTKYTPSSPGSWAAGVNQFMGEIENPSS